MLPASLCAGHAVTNWRNPISLGSISRSLAIGRAPARDRWAVLSGQPFAFRYDTTTRGHICPFPALRGGLHRHLPSPRLASTKRTRPASARTRTVAINAAQATGSAPVCLAAPSSHDFDVASPGPALPVSDRRARGPRYSDGRKGSACCASVYRPAKVVVSAWPRSPSGVAIVAGVAFGQAAM
jgi:hypothetical protein